MIDLDSLSIQELEELIAAARKEVEIRRVRFNNSRNEMEKLARQSGLSAEEAAILFGE